MAFDIEAALRAGYTLPEVVNYLGQQKKFDVDAARQAGYSDSELVRHLAGTLGPQGPKTGFFAGLRGGYESLKGDIGAIGAVAGISGAEEYAAQQRAKAAQTVRTPELTEEPFEYAKTLLGQSIPYMAAPLLAGAAASPAGALAAAGAAGAVSAGQFTGSNITRQIEEGKQVKDVDVMNAVAASIPQAALDVVSLRMIPGIQRIFGAAGRKITEEEAKRIAVDGIMGTTANAVKSYGPAVLKGMTAEGLTEAGQAVLERAQAGLTLTDKEAQKEYFDNFIGGAILGGGIAIPGRAFEKSRAREGFEQERRQAAAEEARREKFPSATQAELPLEGGVAEPEAPVTVQAGKQRAEFADAGFQNQFARDVAASEEDRAAAVQNIGELRQQHDTLMREVDRLKQAYAAATTPEEQAAIVAQADQLNVAREQIASQITTLTEQVAVPRPGTPEARAEETGVATTITDSMLDTAGLPRRSGLFKQLVGKDLTDLRQLDEVQQVIARARANPRVAEDTKEALESIYNTAYNAYAQQGEMFGPRGGVLEPVRQPRAERASKADAKIAEIVEGKDLTDPVQLEEVREAVTDYANGPTRTEADIAAASAFLDTLPSAYPEATDVIESTEPVVAATEPSPAMAGQPGPLPPGGVETLEPAGLGAAPAVTGKPDVGAPVQSTALTTTPSETPTQQAAAPGVPFPVPPTAAPQVQAPAAPQAAGVPAVTEQPAPIAPAGAPQTQTSLAPTAPFTKYRTGDKGKKGIPRDRIEKFLNRIIDRWKNAPKIEIVQNANELPEDIYNQMIADKIKPPGAFDPNTQTVYLIADNIVDEHDAMLTLMHETLGHYGIQGVLGNTYGKVMDDIYNGNLAVRKQAMVKMAQGLDKRTAVEEVLAEMAEKGVYNNAMQRIFNAIRQFIRKLGYNFKAVTDTEIRELLANANRFVYSGEQLQAGAAAPAFKGKPLWRDTSDAFDKWFGNSVVRNENGTPKIMYHGTARDIEEFRPKQAGAIFLTDDPRFAEGFTSMSEDRMVRDLANNLDENPEAKRALLVPLIDAAIKSKDLGTDKNSRGLVKTTREQHIETYMEMPLYRAMNTMGIGDTLREKLRGQLPSRANIIPVYVSAQNPFDFNNPEHIEKLSRQIPLMGEDRADVMRGSWGAIESGRVQDAIKAAGFDGFYVMEGGRKNLAVYDSSQLKSPFNRGTFDRSDRRILYRTRKEKPTTLTPDGEAAAALNDRMKGISNPRPEGVDEVAKGLLGLPKFYTRGENDPSFGAYLRGQIVDKDAPANEKIHAAYNNKIVDAISGKVRSDLLVDQSQDHAAITSLVLEKGGVRIGKDGLAEVYDSEDNMQNVFQIITDKLGKRLGSADLAMQVAHNAGIAQRADEINKFNTGIEAQAQAAEKKGNKTAAKKLRDQKVTVRASQEEIDAGLEAIKTYPEIKEALDMFTRFNDRLIDFMVQTGRINEGTAQNWKANTGYVPWTRVEEEVNNFEVEPVRGKVGLLNIGKLPILDKEGSTKEISNIFDNMIGHTSWVVRTALTARAANAVAEDLPDAVELKTDDDLQRELKNNRSRVIFTYKNGERTPYLLGSGADMAAFMIAPDVLPGIVKPFKSFADILRNFVTHMPAFALSQLIQDGTYRGMLLSGVERPFAIPPKVFKNFFEVLTGQEGTATEIARLGVAGVYDGMPDQVIARAREKFGLAERNAAQKAWGKLEQFSLAADLAVRAAIYEQTLAETKSDAMPEGDRTLALYRAKEYINFKRAGANPVVRGLRHVVPFMNAYIQGMDVLLRTMQGKGVSTADKRKAMQLFWATGIKLAGLNVMYTMLVGDDDEYKGLDEYERAKNYIIPGTGVKIPVAPEVGFLFKVMPEMMTNYIVSQGTDRPESARNFRRAFTDAFVNAYSGVNITPQLIKPALEVGVNYSFFTGNPIIGQAMKNVDPSLQFTSGTSELAKTIGDMTNISPMKLDYLIRGYTGMLGAFVLDATDAMADPNRMDKPINRLPQVSTFMYDPSGRGYKSDFYRFREDVDRVVDTVNLFKREGRGQELLEYLTPERAQVYAMRGIISKVEDTLGNLRKHRNIIAADPNLSGEEKRAMTDALLTQEKEILTAYNIPALREMAGR